MPRAAARAYQVYCNPLHIYVQQDTVATGPLQLTTIEITSFSSDMEPATASSGSQVSSGFQLSQTSMAPSLSIKEPIGAITAAADARVSECDYGLWAEARLNYLGQGYVQVNWMLDNVVIGSEDLQIGPSELRTDLHLNPDREPIVSSHHLISPKLVIDQLTAEQQSRLHEVTVSARVIGDPTMSSVNANALLSALTAESGAQENIALPPPGNKPIDISALYPPVSDSKSLFSKTGLNYRHTETATPRKHH